MKRSDAIKRLKGFIRGVHLVQFNEYADSNRSLSNLVNLIANNTLDFIEDDLKMAPPSRRRTWEPEDEK